MKITRYYDDIHIDKDTLTLTEGPHHFISIKLIIIIRTAVNDGNRQCSPELSGVG